MNGSGEATSMINAPKMGMVVVVFVVVDLAVYSKMVVVPVTDAVVVNVVVEVNDVVAVVVNVVS